MHSCERDLQGIAGYPLSKAGRNSRAEKFLASTEARNVLGQALPVTK